MLVSSLGGLLFLFVTTVHKRQTLSAMAMALSTDLSDRRK